MKQVLRFQQIVERNLVCFRRRTWGIAGCASCKSGTTVNQLLQLRDCDSSLWVAFEYLSEDGGEFRREWQDRAQEIGIPKICSEGRVLNGCALPRITAASQVDQDDTEAPHIIGTRRIIWLTRSYLLTFWNTHG